jgi:hypothetical protein
MANQVTLTFGGESKGLQQAAKEAEKATKDVGGQAAKSSDEFSKAAKGSADFTTKLGSLGAGISGISGAIDDASGTLDAFNQIQNASRNRAQEQKRALQDVRHAQQDFTEAVRDGAEAQDDSNRAVADKAQADLDAAKALAQYNTDVKEFGRNSFQAKQDLLDQRSAQLDGNEAVNAGKRALADLSASSIDAKDAQLDLTDAQAAAHPPDVAKWSQDLQMYAPLLQGLVGIMGLVTAAQMAWNVAQLASPTTWIVLGILALIAVIVLIATHMDWVKKVWRKAWDGIKSAASAVWDWLKKVPGWIGDAFKKVAGYITAPFRAAFNFIADAWNNTIGRLSWTVPGWIPGIGGQSIGVPHIPKFHSGGVVPGAPGSEMLAILQAGEKVTPASGSGGADIVIHSGGSRLDDLLVEILAGAIRNRGGNVQRVLGGARG